MKRTFEIDFETYVGDGADMALEFMRAAMSATRDPLVYHIFSMREVPSSPTPEQQAVLDAAVENCRLAELHHERMLQASTKNIQDLAEAFSADYRNSKTKSELYMSDARLLWAVRALKDKEMELAKSVMAEIIEEEKKDGASCSKKNLLKKEE